MASGAGAGAGAGASAMPPPPAQSSGNVVTRCLGSCASCIKAAQIEKVMNLIRVCNIINGGLLIFSGVWGYIYITDAVYIFYLASYVGLFGLMVIAFELRWKKVENRMRRNFGFMFSPYGRTFFFVFAATLCWGIDLWLPIIVGIGTLFNALLQCFVFCQHPDFKAYSTIKKTDDPANLPDDEVLLYLRNHPDVVQQAAVQTSIAGQPPSRPSRPVPPAAPARPRPAAPPVRATAPPPPAPRKSSTSRAPPPPAPRGGNGGQSDNPFDL